MTFSDTNGILKHELAVFQSIRKGFCMASFFDKSGGLNWEFQPVVPSQTITDCRNGNAPVGRWSPTDVDLLEQNICNKLLENDNREYAQLSDNEWDRLLDEICQGKLGITVKDRKFLKKEKRHLVEELSMI